MQMVILTGGLATRLHPLTQRVPKAMIKIQGKPFLEYQIELLKRNQITDILLCVGHLAEQIKSYFRDGKDFGVNICYSEERGGLLGTGGALKNAEPLLNEEFFLMNGDSYLMLNYEEIASFFKTRNKLALMVVYKNYNKYDRSNVIVEGGMVKAYDRKRRSPQMIHIDVGLSIVKRQALALIPKGKPALLDELWVKLIAQKQLLAFETRQRFYEIGSFDGLREFEQLIKKGKANP